jgi:hypothetical protein
MISILFEKISFLTLRVTSFLVTNLLQMFFQSHVLLEGKKFKFEGIWHARRSQRATILKGVRVKKSY